MGSSTENGVNCEESFNMVEKNVDSLFLAGISPGKAPSGRAGVGV